MPTFVIVCFSYREFVIIFNQLNIKWRYFNGNLNLNATYFYKKESFWRSLLALVVFFFNPIFGVCVTNTFGHILIVKCDKKKLDNYYELIILGAIIFYSIYLLKI